MLRATEEWSYVEREVDVRLTRRDLNSVVMAGRGRPKRGSGFRSPMRRALPLQKPPRGDPRQMGDRPVVEIGPGFAAAPIKRHRQHLPDIFGRLRKPLAAGLIHVEFAQQFAGARSR